MRVSSGIIGSSNKKPNNLLNGLRRRRRQSSDRLRRAVSGVHCEALESRMLLSVVGPFYVSSTAGSDTAAGTSTNAPFLTIQRALTAFGSSNTGTVYVEGGTYVLDNGNSSYNTGGIVMPSQGGITLTNYQGGAVYIVGGQAINSTNSTGWTQYSGNVYETTLNSTGPLGYVDSGTTIATIQEIFENFNPTATSTEQDELNQYGVAEPAGDFNNVGGDDGGFVDYYRENKLALPSGLISDLPSGSWYIDGLSNTLYVNVGGNPTTLGVTLTASSPHVLEDLSGGGGGNVVSNLNFEISDSSGESSSSTASTALTEFEDGTGGWSDTGGAVRVANNSELLDCNVYYGALANIEIQSTDVDVIGCGSYWAGCTGVITNTSHGFLLQYDNIEDSNIRNFSVEWGSGGIKIIPECYDGTVTDCQIAYSNGSGLWSDTNDDTGESPLVFSDNYIHNNVGSPLAMPSPTTYNLWADAGIKIEVSTYVECYNNLVVANGPVGILLAGCEYCDVYNNTIAENVGFAALLGDTDGNRTDVTLRGSTNDYQLSYNTIENNLFYNNSTTYDLDLTILPSSTTNGTGQPLAIGNVSDYNLFYRFGEPIQLTYGDPDNDDAGDQTSLGNMVTTLSNWQSATAAAPGGEEEDAHSISSDPLFAADYNTIGWSYNQAVGPTSYVSGNYFVLSSTSLARGAGSPSVTLSTPDYQKVNRSSPFDIGAYQYNGDSGVSPFTPPTLNSDAWVDDTLPQGAVVYNFSSSYIYTSGGSKTTVSSVRVEPFNWVANATPDTPYDWGSGVYDGDNAIADTDVGLSSSKSDIMSFMGATQTMSISSSTDTLFLYVYEAPSSSATAPATTTPSEVGVSFYDSTLGKWLSAYWGASNVMGSVLPNAQSGSGTPKAGQWVELTINAGTLGMSGGDQISGLTLASYGGEAAFDEIGDIPAESIASIKVSPASANVDETATQTFTATAYDQNGNALATQPTFTWSLGNGSYGGINSATGVYTAPATAGSATVIATADGVNGQASVTIVAATVANEFMFYYGSSAFDGSATTPSSADFNAIAENADGSDKTALLPNGTAATFANVSSYADGINGILIDFANLKPGITLSASDFQFTVGNNSNTSSWSTAPAPTAVATWTGPDGDTFADIVWANNAIQEEWLGVTVLADADTHLANNLTFYFGSEIGATGVSTATTSNGPVLRVTSADVVNTENNASLLQSVPISNIYDFNRDGKVTSTDVVLCQNNATLLGGLELITVGSSSDVLVADSTASPAVAASSSAASFSDTPIDDSTSSTPSVLDQNDDLLQRIVRHRRQ
jgi:hypothetical protein